MSVRFSVQEHPDGWAVWEVCPDVLARGECRYALWCQCGHTDGGPLCSIWKLCASLSEALEVADKLEAGDERM